MNAKHKTLAAVVALIFGAIAVRAGFELANHGVNLWLTISAAFAIFTIGLDLARWVIEAATTHIYRCPIPGCLFSVRATGISEAEQREYQALATTHTRHTDS